MGDIKELLGLTMASVDQNDYEEIVFTATTGEKFKMYHSQDCCEEVLIEDICGDLSDLVGSPILMAEESYSEEAPEGVVQEYKPESQTWTFYKLATAKGYVTIRWFGSSNGYYSESVEFRRTN